LFFAVASRLRYGDGPRAVVITGFVALVALLLLGEILPKSIAYRAPVGISRALAVPIGVLVSILAPVRATVTWSLELLFKALDTHVPEAVGISSEMLEQVLAKSAKDGLLERDEAAMLGEIIELEEIRVREIMTPRVDCLLLDVQAELGDLVEQALQRHMSWLPVVDGDVDQVLGCVRLRDLLLNPEKPISQLVMPVKFVPEVARVLDLLHEFRADRATEAVVVDEWGGTAGVVTIEDVFEEIVGDLRVEGEERDRPVVPLGEGRYRVSGALSVRDWNEEFGTRIVPTEFETVGGFVTAELGHIPRVGETLEIGPLRFEVQELRGRRIVQLDISATSGGSVR
ncbi:MAG: HlyC/CorC family transporter, partial [Planctomycetes bacterium]|nr:HlyC/CorC family transporter [Planctomycetota bacterium]